MMITRLYTSGSRSFQTLSFFRGVAIAVTDASSGASDLAIDWRVWLARFWKLLWSWLCTTDCVLSTTGETLCASGRGSTLLMLLSSALYSSLLSAIDRIHHPPTQELQSTHFLVWEHLRRPPRRLVRFPDGTTWVSCENGSIGAAPTRRR